MEGLRIKVEDPTINDLFSSWIPFRLPPFYVVSDNDVVENGKRSLMIGFKSEGEPALDKRHFPEAIDLTVRLSDFEGETQRTFVALVTGKLSGSAAPKKALKFRWIKRSFYVPDPGSAVMTSLEFSPLVDVVKIEKDTNPWKAALVVGTSPSDLDIVYELQLLMTKPFKAQGATEEPWFWKSICVYPIANQFQLLDSFSLKQDEKRSKGGNYVIQCPFVTKDQCLKRFVSSFENRAVFNQRNGLTSVLDSITSLISHNVDANALWNRISEAVWAERFVKGRMNPFLFEFIYYNGVDRSLFHLSMLFEDYVTKESDKEYLYDETSLLRTLLENFTVFSRSDRTEGLSDTVDDEAFLNRMTAFVESKMNVDPSTIALPPRNQNFMDSLLSAYAATFKQEIDIGDSQNVMKFLFIAIYALPRVLESFCRARAEELFDEINVRHGAIDRLTATNLDGILDFDSFFRSEILNVEKSHDVYRANQRVKGKGTKKTTIEKDAALVVVTKITENDAMVVKYPAYTNAPLLPPLKLRVSEKTTFSPLDVLKLSFGNNESFLVDGHDLSEYASSRSIWKWCKTSKTETEADGRANRLDLRKNFYSTYYLTVDCTDDVNGSVFELWLVSDVSLRTSVIENGCSVVTKQMVLSAIVETPLNARDTIVAGGLFKKKVKLPSNRKMLDVVVKTDENEKKGRNVLESASFSIIETQKSEIEGRSLTLVKRLDDFDRSGTYSALVDTTLANKFQKYWKKTLIKNANHRAADRISRNVRQDYLRDLFSDYYWKLYAQYRRFMNTVISRDPNAKIEPMPLDDREGLIDFYLNNNELYLLKRLVRGTLNKNTDPNKYSDKALFYAYRSMLAAYVYERFGKFPRLESFDSFENLFYGASVDVRLSNQIGSFFSTDTGANSIKQRYILPSNVRRSFLTMCVNDYAPSLKLSFEETVKSKWKDVQPKWGPNQPQTEKARLKSLEEARLELLADFCSKHKRTLEEALVKLLRDNLHLWWDELLNSNIFHKSYFRGIKSPSAIISLAPLLEDPSKSREYSELIDRQLKELEEFTKNQQEESRSKLTESLDFLTEDIDGTTFVYDAHSGNPYELDDESHLKVKRIVVEYVDSFQKFSDAQSLALEEKLKAQAKERFDFLYDAMEKKFENQKRIAVSKNDTNELYDVSVTYASDLETIDTQSHEFYEKLNDLVSKRKERAHDVFQKTMAPLKDEDKISVRESVEVLKTDVDNLKDELTHFVKFEEGEARPPLEAIIDVTAQKSLLNQELDLDDVKIKLLSAFSESIHRAHEKREEDLLKEEAEKREAAERENLFERERYERKERKLRALKQQEEMIKSNREIAEALAETQRQMQKAMEEARQAEERRKEAETKERQQLILIEQKKQEEGGIINPEIVLALQTELEQKQRETTEQRAKEEKLQREVSELARSVEEMKVSAKKFEEETKAARLEAERLEKEREEAERTRAEALQKELKEKEERKRIKEEERKKAKEEEEKRNREVEEEKRRMFEQLEQLREDAKRRENERIEAERQAREKMEALRLENKLLEEKLAREEEEKRNIQLLQREERPPSNTSSLGGDEEQREEEDETTRLQPIVPATPPRSSTSGDLRSPMTKVVDKLSTVFAFTSESEPRRALESLRTFVHENITNEFKSNLLASLATSEGPSPSTKIGEHHPLYRLFVDKMETLKTQDRENESWSPGGLKELGSFAKFLFVDWKILTPLDDLEFARVQTEELLKVTLSSVLGRVAKVYDDTTVFYLTAELQRVLSDVNRTKYTENVFNRVRMILTDYLRLKFIMDIGVCFEYNPHYFWFPDALQKDITDYESESAFNRKTAKSFTALFDKVESYSFDKDVKKETSSFHYAFSRIKWFIRMKTIARGMIDNNTAISPRVCLFHMFYYETFVANWTLNRFLSASLMNCFKKSTSKVYQQEDVRFLKTFAYEFAKKEKHSQFVKTHPKNTPADTTIFVPSYASNAVERETIENFELVFTTPHEKVGSMLETATKQFVAISSKVSRAFKALLSEEVLFESSPFKSPSKMYSEMNVQERSTTKQVGVHELPCLIALVATKKRMEEFRFRSIVVNSGESATWKSSIWLKNGTENSESVVRYSLAYLHRLLGSSEELHAFTAPKRSNKGLTFPFKTKLSFIVPMDDVEMWDLLMPSDRYKSTESATGVYSRFLVGPRIDPYVSVAPPWDPSEAKRTENFPRSALSRQMTSDHHDCLILFKFLSEVNPEWIFRNDLLHPLRTISWNLNVLKVDGSTGELYDESNNAWGKTRWLVSEKKDATRAEETRAALKSTIENNYDPKTEDDLLDGEIIRKYIHAAERSNNRVPLLAVLLQLQAHTATSLSENQSKILNGFVFELKRLVDADQDLSGMGVSNFSVDSLDYVSDLLDYYERFETRRKAFEYTDQNSGKLKKLPKTDAIGFLKKTCGKNFDGFYSSLDEKSLSNFESTFDSFLASYPHVRLLMHCYFYKKVNEEMRPAVLYSAQRQTLFASLFAKTNKLVAMDAFDIKSALNKISLNTSDGVTYSVNINVNPEDAKWFSSYMATEFSGNPGFENTTVKGGTIFEFVIDDVGSFLYGTSDWGKYALGLTRSEMAGFPSIQTFLGNIDLIGSVTAPSLNALAVDISKPRTVDVTKAKRDPKFVKKIERTKEEEEDLVKKYVCIGEKETDRNYRSNPKRFDALAKLDEFIEDFVVYANGDGKKEMELTKSYKASDIYDKGTLIVRI